MKQYHDLLRRLLAVNEVTPDRTGVGTYRRFGEYMRFDLSEGFPLITTKRVWFRGILHELLWFLSGECHDISYLVDNGVHIWDAWANEHRGVGPIYGKQWRSWPGKNGPVDQLAQVIESIKTDPYSRRHVISAWNVSQLDDMALPPCHGVAIQFFVSQDNKLSCQMYQRSADVFLGVPFNIASYACLTHMIAMVSGLEVGEFIHVLGDAHLYTNHVDAVTEQLTRPEYALPELRIKREVESIDDFVYDDFELIGYRHHPTIKAPVAV